MKTVDWEQAFEWDGSLRDLYVRDTGLGDWQQLLRFLSNSEYKVELRINDETILSWPELTWLFEHRADLTPLLAVTVNGIELHSHFFCVEQIEFDLDPREVNSQGRAESLIAFMRDIAHALSKEVRLTPENMPEVVLYKFEPDNDE